MEVFAVSGHPRASLAYAWEYEADEGKRTFTAVLGGPPVNSARVRCGPQLRRSTSDGTARVRPAAVLDARRALVAFPLLGAATKGRESEGTVRIVRMLAGVLFLTFGIAGILPTTWAPTAQAAGIEEKIAAANTPADHEAIAAYYDGEAKEAQDKADEHKKMGEAYKKGGGSYANKTHFHEHCEALARNYAADAKEYRALAAAHRDMAKKAK